MEQNLDCYNKKPICPSPVLPDPLFLYGQVLQ